MAKGDLIRLGLFSILLVIVIGFYSNLGVLSFNNVNVSETLPKPVKTEPTITGNNIPSITASVDNAKKLNLNFELVGIRGNSYSLLHQQVQNLNLTSWHCLQRQL